MADTKKEESSNFSNKKKETEDELSRIEIEKEKPGVPSQGGEAGIAPDGERTTDLAP